METFDSIYATAIEQLQKTCIDGLLADLLKEQEAYKTATKEAENQAKKSKVPATEQLKELKATYEFKRAQKLKLLFAHHCNIQMFIHAKSIEIYANLHFKVNNVDNGTELLNMHQSQPKMVQMLREQGHKVSVASQP